MQFRRASGFNFFDKCMFAGFCTQIVAGYYILSIDKEERRQNKYQDVQKVSYFHNAVILHKDKKLARSIKTLLRF